MLGSIKTRAFRAMEESQGVQIYPFPGWRGIRVRREADEGILVSTGPAWGCRVRIWGCCRFSGPGSATLWAQRMGSDYLEILSAHVLPLIEFFFPDDAGTFQDDNSRILGTQIARAVQGWWDIISHTDGSRVQTSTPWGPLELCWMEIVEDCGGKVRASVFVIWAGGGPIKH